MHTDESERGPEIGWKEPGGKTARISQASKLCPELPSLFCLARSPWNIQLIIVSKRSVTWAFHGPRSFGCRLSVPTWLLVYNELSFWQPSFTCERMTFATCFFTCWLVPTQPALWTMTKTTIIRLWPLIAHCLFLHLRHLSVDRRRGPFCAHSNKLPPPRGPLSNGPDLDYQTHFALLNIDFKYRTETPCSIKLDLELPKELLMRIRSIIIIIVCCAKKQNTDQLDNNKIRRLGIEKRRLYYATP